MKKKIGIDARPLEVNEGGIKRYFTETVSKLVKNDDFVFVLYFDNKPLELPSWTQSHNVETRRMWNARISKLLWHIIVPHWARKDQIDLFWSPRHHLPLILPRNCKSLLTIHDLIWKTHPDTMPLVNFLSEKLLMPLSIKQSDRIICVSHTTKKQLDNYFPNQLGKTNVIYNGQDAIKQSKNTDGDSKPNPNHEGKNYFLCVGTLEPRKNYSRLVYAFQDYIKNGGGQNLIIVGKQGWKFKSLFKEITSLDCASQISVLKNVDDLELQRLYSQASGFISVSLDEGFGIPALEASSFGLPLLLSDIDIYRELFYADIWVSPLSVEKISQALTKLQSLPSLRSSQNRKLGACTWDISANKHIESIKKLVSLNS